MRFIDFHRILYTVIILKENDMKMYFEYMSNVYGENWKKDYKNGIIPSKKAKLILK